MFRSTVYFCAFLFLKAELHAKVYSPPTTPPRTATPIFETWQWIVLLVGIGVVSAVIPCIVFYLRSLTFEERQLAFEKTMQEFDRKVLLFDKMHEDQQKIAKKLQTVEPSLRSSMQYFRPSSMTTPLKLLR